MLTAIVLLHELKWIIPTSFMIGVAPAFFTVTALWKIVSAPFPYWVFTKGDDFLFSTYHRQLLFYFEIWSGIEIIFYGDLDSLEKLKDGENCIYMSNHQSTVDWVLGSCMSYRRGALGRTRYILKDGLRFLPLYGFYLDLHGSIFVKRAKKYSKEKAQRELRQMAKNKKPMWLIIFPEGTRFNPELSQVTQASKQFAESKSLSPLESVLFPRSKALQVCLEQLKETVDSVYDVTLAYGKTFNFETKTRRRAPTMQEVLLGVPQKIHIHVKRIPVKDIPHDEAKLSQWLYQRYQEKDKLLSEFYGAESEKEARFKGPSKTIPLSLKSLLPSVMLWSGGFIAINAFQESRQFYVKLAVGTAVLGTVWMAIKG